jgi:hypothetical protein
MTKKILCTKNAHVLKLLCNIVTARTEILVALGNTFLFALVKEICRLWTQPCFDTFHQLLIIAEALWLQTGGSCSERAHGCKEGVQTPSSNAPTVLEWNQLYWDMHCYGWVLHLCQHSMPLGSNGLMQAPPPVPSKTERGWGCIPWYDNCLNCVYSKVA